MEKLQQIPHFEFIKVIGCGAFGYVFEAYDQQKRQKVAIKRMQKVGKLQSRECDILQQIKSCKNIVKLLDVFYTKNDENKMIQNIVLEYVDDNLENMIQQHRKLKKYFDTSLIKSYLCQMLQGLEFIHKKGIAHRDLKPENVLVQNDIIKLCDFGSSKVITPKSINTPYIVSRFYRAPELLLGITHYSVAIDLWAVGCIMAELALLQPLFPGQSEGGQLFEILKILGSFSEDDILYFSKHVPFNPKLFNEFPDNPKTKLQRKFKHINDQELFLDLLLKLLTYNPEKRITAGEALKHQFFAELFEQ